MCSRPSRLQSTPHMRGATSVFPSTTSSLAKLQSTPHMRGATSRMNPLMPLKFYFNPRPTCVGRPSVPRQSCNLTVDFNPRPTCVGRHIRKDAIEDLVCTSIHAPHAWGDIWILLIAPLITLLQSTPHMRGATRAEQREQRATLTSIHAPHAWGDIPDDDGRNAALNFNPRPTCVGRQD